MRGRDMNMCHATQKPPVGLSVNLMKAPFGIRRQAPAFSWILREGEGQSAYRLVVAESSSAAEAGIYLYDAGWVISAQSTAVIPDRLAPLLADNRLYYWQVAVRNTAGEESGFSHPTAFSTEMGAEWTSTDGIWGEEESSFVFLRTEFELSEADLDALDRVILTVTATSPEPARQYVYNAYVNGTCAGVGPARLGREPDGTTALYYHTYDVTLSVWAGANCLSALCYATEGKMFLCQLTAFFTDGSRRVLTNSARDAGDWRTLDGDGVFRPDHSIGTGYFLAHANNLDMTRYPSGFDRAGFDDAAWSIPVDRGEIRQGVGADALLIPLEVAPVTRYPADGGRVTVTPLGEGRWVIDLGAEIVGGLRLSVNSPAVCTLRVYYGEQLNPDGTVKYRMNTANVYTETWTLREGEQVAETFGMMAFRYVEIEGCPVEITPQMVTGMALRAPFEMEAASFSSDCGLLNDIYGLMAHTVKVTTQDLYVDSQSRERGAYEGDLLINLMAAYAFGNDYSTGRFSAEYLYTHRTWPAEYILFAVMAARADYMVTGDHTSLRRYYPILREKTFTRFFDPDFGLLTSGNPNSSGLDAILVDWPPSERDGYDMGVKFNTVLNALASRAYTELAEIARVVGAEEDAMEFDTLSWNIRESLLTRCYDAERGIFWDGLAEDGTPSAHASQHTNAFALYSGIYTDAVMAHRLASVIEARGKICMSVYGAYFLLMGLYEIGHGHIANKLLMDEDASEGARTWAYMLRTMGATVTTEAWNMTNKPNMTLSHPWGAAPAHAITGGIFGIKPTSAGYNTFDLRFQTTGLGRGSLTMPTVKGSISASFQDGECFTAAVTVPVNAVATVYIPAERGERLFSEESEVPAVYKDGYLSVTVGAGCHTWEVRPQN